MKYPVLASGIMALFLAPVFAKAGCAGEGIGFHGTIASWLAKYNTTVGLELIDFQMDQGLGLNTKIEYGIKRSEVNPGVVNRTERYIIGLPLRGNVEFSSNEDFTIGLGIEQRPTLDIRFLRHFNDACDAVKARIYWVDQMPFNVPGKHRVNNGTREGRAVTPTETVLSQLKAGDMVTSKGLAQLIVSGSFATQFAGSIFSLDAHLYYALRGYFTTHIVKLDNSRVHVKVLAERTKGPGFGLSIGVVGGELMERLNANTGSSFADNLIEDGFDLKILKVNVALNDRQVVAADYTLDLNNPEVSAAFNKMLAVSVFKAPLDAMKLQIDGANGAQRLVTFNTKPLEDVRQTNNPYIVRDFLGKSEGTSTDSSLKLNLFWLFRSNTTSQIRDELITTYDSNDQKQCGFVSSSKRVSNFSGLLGLFGKKTKREMSAYSDSPTCDRMNIVPKTLVFNYAVQFNEYGRSQAAEFEQTLRRNIPASTLNKMQLGYRPQAGRTASFQVIMSTEQFLGWVQTANAWIKEQPFKNSYAAIEAIYADYLNTMANQNLSLVAGLMRATSSQPTSPDYPHNYRMYEGKHPDVKRLAGTIDTVSRYLYEVLRDPSQPCNVENTVADFLCSARPTPASKIHALMALRTNTLFMQTGIGFLNHLFVRAGSDSLYNNTLTSVRLPGQAIQMFGNPKTVSETYRRLALAREILEDGEIDLFSELAYLNAQDNGIVPNYDWGSWIDIKWMNPSSWKM